MEYQKIQTIFKRDAKNVIIPTEFTLPEYEWLKNCKFSATEKIDGTNMRVEIESGKFTFGGKTDNAQVPTHLLKKMQEIFTEETLDKFFGEKTNWHEEGFKATIFGEGYGVKIQKGGNYISNGTNFILFDVRIGNWWLTDEAIREMAARAGIDVVPYMGEFTIQEAIDFVKKGFKSTIAENKDYDAEGLVLKTPHGLLLRNGQRICFKVKTCDFRKFEQVYGADYTGPQPANPKYKE